MLRAHVQDSHTPESVINCPVNRVQVHRAPSAVCVTSRCCNERLNLNVDAINNTPLVRRARVAPKSLKTLWYLHGMNAAFRSSEAGWSNLEPTGCCWMREPRCIDTAVSCRRRARAQMCVSSPQWEVWIWIWVWFIFCSQTLMHMWTRRQMYTLCIWLLWNYNNSLTHSYALLVMCLLIHELTGAKIRMTLTEYFLIRASFR